MRITHVKLSRMAGLSAELSGLLFVVVQFVHAPENVAAVATQAWATTGYLTMGFAVLGLVGIAGIYLRQVEEVGFAGLVGFVLLGAFLLLTTAFTFAEALILPAVVNEAPQFVDNFLGITDGTGTDGTLGSLEMVGLLAGMLYVVGGLLAGIATFRARILSPWAAVLLAVGAVLPLLIPLVPHSVGRLAAIPVGVALAGLGHSLRSNPLSTRPPASRLADQQP